jgi:hypothetical protein
MYFYIVYIYSVLIKLGGCLTSPLFFILHNFEPALL